MPNKRKKKRKKSEIKKEPKKLSLLNSPAARKTILLTLIIMAMFYNAAIFFAGKENFRPMTSEKSPRIARPWERNIRKMVAGYPMEKMVPSIGQKNKTTAAFLVSIAKKESNWGRRSPRLDGKDCFNYWGYMGGGEKITPGGYTCFESPAHAVAVVGKRIDQLVKESNLNTPEKMVVWKCGWDCSWDNPYAVKKWIRDVAYYFEKIHPEKIDS